MSLKRILWLLSGKFLESWQEYKWGTVWVAVLIAQRTDAGGLDGVVVVKLELKEYPSSVVEVDLKDLLISHMGHRKVR